MRAFAIEMRGKILQSKTELGVLVPGGKTGVLLLHDVGGSAAELRPFAQALARAGWTVSGPQLTGLGSESVPGHGTAGMLVSEAEQALSQLRRRCESVVVVGIAYGAMLALELARHNAVAVQAAVLVDPRAWLPRLPFPLPTALSGRLKQTWIADLLAVTSRLGPRPTSAGVVGPAGAGDRQSGMRDTLRSLSSLLDSVHAGLPAVKQPVMIFHQPESVRSGRDGSFMLQRRLGGRVESVMSDLGPDTLRQPDQLAERSNRFIAAVLEEIEVRRGNELRRQQVAAGRTDAA